MEIHQARYFLALARTLNFTRAAEACNVTQPALTKAVQKLEQELGGPLIYREFHHTHLTDLGNLVLPMLEQTVAAADKARLRALEYRGMQSATLRIALAPAVPATLMVDPLAELSRAVPYLEVDIVDLEPERMADGLLNGEVHAAIGLAPLGSGAGVSQWTLFRERYVVFCAGNHPFARLSSLSVSDLRQAVWLEQVGCGIWKEFRRQWFTLGESPLVRHRGCHDEQLQTMAAAGLGVMLGPEHSPTLPGIVRVPIEGDLLQRKVQLMVASSRSSAPELQAFMKIVRQRDWRSSPTKLLACGLERAPPHGLLASDGPAPRTDHSLR